MTTVYDAMQTFLLARDADGAAQTSIKWYRAILLKFVDAHQHDEIATIDANMIRRHLAARRGQIAPASYASLNTAMHAFWNWITVEYHLAENPMRNIKRARPPQPAPKAISAHDFRRMFDLCGTDDQGVRDRALLAFLADSGSRPGGVAGLTVDDLHINEGFAVVTEKGHKTRRVIFTHATGRMLHQWLLLRKVTSPGVFTSMTTGEPLTYWGVYLAIKRLGIRAGVQGYASPKAFRHAFAREYVLSGGDIVTLARLMGHASTDTTTAFYAVFSAPEIAILHAERSPLLRLLHRG